MESPLKPLLAGLIAAALAAAAPAGASIPLDSLSAAAPPPGLPPRRQPVIDPFPGASEWRILAPCGETPARVRVLNPRPVLGEPVLLEFQYFTTRLNSEGKLFELFPFSTFGRDMSLLVAPPRGRPFAYIPRDPSIGATGVRAAQIQRGQRLTIRIPILYDGDSVSFAVFEAPGEHRLVLQFNCSDAVRLDEQPRRSPPIEFVVDAQAPEGDDLVAWGILRDTGAFDSLHSLRLRDPAHLPLIERVVEEAPLAAVRPFCLALLVAEARREGRDADAEALALRFLEDHPRHIHSRTAYLALLDIREGTGRRDEAFEVVEALWSDPFLAENIPASRSSLRQWVPVPPQGEEAVESMHWPFVANSLADRP